MADIRSITCLRPQTELAARIATGPHSEYSNIEIKEKILENPLSYSRIVHPKCFFGQIPDVYERTSAVLKDWVSRGIFLEDETEAVYIYQLICEGHVQSGLVGATPIDDIISGRVHAHEKIRENKLADLAAHITACGAQVGGPVLMAMRRSDAFSGWMRREEEKAPLYDFVSENGVKNRIWRITGEDDIKEIHDIMAEAGDLYIADGHHRVMASVSLCRKKREVHPEYTGAEPWNFLPCVVFCENELNILPYPRVVRRSRCMDPDGFAGNLARLFSLSEAAPGDEPEKRGEFIMITGGRCTRLTLKEELRPAGPQASLDVAVLQELVLKPLFGITDPRTDSGIGFIGGGRYKEELTSLCASSEYIGFLPYHTSMQELFAVADAGETMPPKSTWFEPKLCNGLFIYRLDQE